MAGKLQVDDITDSAVTGAPTFSQGISADGIAKVRCQYNQVTDTLVDSFNVSGVVDNSAGLFTVSYTTNFAVAINYSFSITVVNLSGNQADRISGAYNTKAVGSLQSYTLGSGGGLVDFAEVSILCWGDQ